MMKTFLKLGYRSSEMFTSAMKPFLLSDPSAEKAHLRHQGGLYSVPSCFCHCYCCQRCCGNRVSFDHVFRNVLTINTRGMWWPGSYLSLQAGDICRGCKELTHTEAWEDRKYQLFGYMALLQESGTKTRHMNRKENSDLWFLEDFGLRMCCSSKDLFSSTTNQERDEVKFFSGN